MKVSAPKGITAREVRRELKTMINLLRYSDGFPGEVRAVMLRGVCDVSRLGLRYHLQPLAAPKRASDVRSDMLRHKREARKRLRAKAKMEMRKHTIPRRRISPW